MMSARGIADELSMAQRNCLIDHIDKSQPINKGEFTTQHSLVRRQLLRGDGNTSYPKFTVMTELGREVLGVVLGYYADALMRAEIIAIEALSPVAPTSIQPLIVAPAQAAVARRHAQLVERIREVAIEQRKSYALHSSTVESL